MSCNAIVDPLFLPAMRIITNITNAYPAVVTTSFAHNLLDGEIVRIVVPTIYKMTQINQLSGTVLVIDPVTFSIDIDTRFFDAFVVPPLNYHTCSQVVPFAEANAMLRAAVHNVLG